jgi:hypothetical protein
VSTDEVREQWQQLVGHWLSDGRRPTRTDVAELRELGLARVVAGLADEAADRVPSEEDLVRCEVAVLRGSELFDVRAYTRTNAPVRNGKVEAVEHFCTIGWETLCNPSRGFDVWWYWAEYLDPTVADFNPLLHFELVGRHRGHHPVPPRTPPRPPTGYAPGARPRRVCLFAGYDPDALIDDYVVDYVRELARHADVYYLSDGYVEPDQLDRLSPYTKGAWAVAHGGYDFGSLSILARDLVGWEVLDTYDEVMFANDSAFLLRPLDEVFARMDAEACDWWGLQATKHGFEKHSNGGRPLESAEMKRRMVGERFMNDLDHLHLSSYFLVFRAPVVRDEGFRRRLDSVAPQVDKELVIHKYEIGLSRYLMCRGFDFETFIPGLYPFHPLYTEQYFDLLELGFPLLKRNFLSENSRNVPDLVRWKERVRRAVPDAQVDMLERNLLRVSPDDRLQRSFALTGDNDESQVAPRPLSWWELVQEDRHAPKFDHWWSFPVDQQDHQLPGSARAVFEAVREDPSIKKIILTRSRRIDLDGVNVTVLPLHSPQGQHHLVRSKHLFVSETPGTEPTPLVPPRLHRVINLAAVPLQRAPAPADGTVTPPYWAVVTSSRLSALAAATTYAPLDQARIWTTGDPRDDLLLCGSGDLPADLQEQEARLSRVLADRRLVLFEPTYRPDQPGGGYPRFDPAELEWLATWCSAQHAVLGFRDDPRDRSRGLTRILGSLGAVSLTRNRFPSLEVVDRVAGALVTDHPARAVQFAATRKPMVLLTEEGPPGVQHAYGTDWVHDLRAVLPATVAPDFEALAEALEALFEPRRDEEWLWRRRLLVEHSDMHNARRLVGLVRRRYLVKA